MWETWTDSASGILWLRDLFPHRAQNARILAYDYPSQRLVLSGDVHQILPYATTLVAELAANRWHDNCEQRPIIFICHGLGGLLTKKALVHAASSRSKATEHRRSIYTSTFAILFMGTPHLGIEKPLLFPPLGVPTSISAHFLDGLRKDSSFLKELTDQFAPLMKRFRIYNFWEGRDTLNGSASVCIVGTESAAPAWDVVERSGIDATHSGMVKFNNDHDKGYRVVLAALQKYQQEAPRLISLRWEQEIAARLAERAQEAAELYMCPAPDRGGPRQPMVCGATSRQEYMVPRASSNFFVSREVPAKEARHSLGLVEEGPVWRRPKILVVNGLGGSGKTQFTLRYAEESRGSYWGIFWVDASSQEKLEMGLSSVATLARKGSTPSSAVHWLSTCLQPWLLIFDNADDPDMDWSSHLPPGGNGHVIITTRNPGANIMATCGCIKLSGMDPEEATVLLLRCAYPGSTKE